MSARSLTLFLLLALVGACSRSDETDPAARPTTVTSGSTEELPEAPPPVPVAPDEADERRRNDTLAAAANAAEGAERGANECEYAYNQLVALFETLARESGQPQHPLSRPDFLSVCAQLPAPARTCIVPTNAMNDSDRCAEVLEAVPEDLAQQLQMILNGPEGN